MHYNQMDMKRLLIIFFISNYFLAQAEQPITLFCHGIVDSQTQSKRFEAVLESPVQTFNFPDAQTPQEYDLNSLIFQSCSLFGKFVNRNQMFMGHGKDIQAIAAQIDHTKEYILYGVSRGGTAAINYIAQYNPSNIKALILDATPADMISPVETLQYMIGYKFAPTRDHQERIFNTIFPSYEIGATSPKINIENIKDKNLPIFIIHSAEDSKVSIASAWQLYLAFKNNGFHHVYLCQLQTGRHSFALQGTEKDKYIHALHSFYKKYHFKYDEQYADIDLGILQPSIEEIQDKLDKYQSKLEEIYKTQQNRLQNSMTYMAIATIAAGGYHLNTISIPKQDN